MTTAPLGSSPQQLRARAIELAQQGQLDHARDLLHQTLQYNPGDELALLWLAQVSPYREEQISALERALALNPANAPAQSHLAALRAAPAAQPVPPPSRYPAPYPPPPPTLQALHVPNANMPPPVIVAGPGHPIVLVRSNESSWVLTLLGAVLIAIGLLAGIVSFFTILSLLDPGPRGQQALGVGDHVGFGIFVWTCLTALAGGLGLVLKKAWGWSATLLLGCSIIVATATAWIVLGVRAVRTDTPETFGAQSCNFTLVALVELGMLIFLTRQSVIQQLGVSPGYRNRFTVAALLVGCALSATVVVVMR